MQADDSHRRDQYTAQERGQTTDRRQDRASDDQTTFTMVQRITIVI
jgi:hypothetical protein